MFLGVCLLLSPVLVVIGIDCIRKIVEPVVLHDDNWKCFVEVGQLIFQPFHSIVPPKHPITTMSMKLNDGERVEIKLVVEALRRPMIVSGSAAIIDRSSDCKARRHLAIFGLQSGVHLTYEIRRLIPEIVLVGPSNFTLKSGHDTLGWSVD